MVGSAEARPRAVSVVVCAYTLDRWDQMVAAVDSARRQEPRPSEVILVVDHSPALLERALGLVATSRETVAEESAGAPAPLIVAENTGPKGLSGARNAGVGAATGEIVAFLDDDAAAEPGWLAALAAPYADARVIGTGGRADPVWATGRPSWFPAEFDWVVGCSYTGLPTSDAPVRNPLGCNMSFRRAVFEEVGGFRPEVGRIGSLPVGCEETELAVRARSRWPDGEIVYVPGAAVRHHVPAGRGRFAYFRSRCYSEGRSKAVVAAIAGRGRALSSERSYTLRVLPRGVARGLRDLARGDAAGGTRAAAIVAGFLATVIGYGLGRASIALGRSPRPVLPAEAAGPRRVA